ncbi:MAG TPA: two-component regulator propeller domain-containing protein [Chitinophagales bacterium]|nr:two-component regulator propeller domain-containing protein [Chitinophagales bacterium]
MKNPLPLFLLLAALTATAQDDVIFTRYSHFDGLPASFSNSRMMEDQSGLLWIYTEQGFVRYDGYSFKMYPFGSADIWGTSLSTGFFSEMQGFERVFLTIDRVVFVYNPLVNGFERHDFNKLVREEKGENFSTLDDARNHCIWVSAGRNLFRLSYSGRIKQFDAPASPTKKYLLPSNKIIYKNWDDSILLFDITTEKFSTEYLKGAKEFGELYSDYYDNRDDYDKCELVSKVILSADAKKVFWFNKTSPVLPKVIAAPSPLVLPPGIYRIVTLTDSNNLWADLHGTGLVHVDLVTGAIDSIDVHIAGNPNKDYRITGIIEDRDHEIWASFASNGVMRVNVASGKVTQYLTVPGNPNSLWANSTFGIIYDGYGALWVNNPSFGLVKIEKQRNIFRTIVPLTNEFSNLSSRFEALDTRTLLPLDNDHLLAGTLANICDVNIKTGKVDLVRYDDHTVVQELNVIRAYGAAVADKRGNIIIGTWDGWLYTYNSHSKTCRAHYNIPGGPVNVSSGKAYRAMLLDSRNMLWIGSKQGLFRVQADSLIYSPSPRLQAVSLNDTGTGRISTERTIFAFMEDHNKNVWVGSMSGIKVFSPDGKITSYTHEVGKNSLSANEVRCFAEDNPDGSGGNIWIATIGGGLNKLDAGTHQFTAYTTKDGLPDNSVYTIIIDKENNLWLSSNLGLTRFNPTNPIVNTFTPFDGLQSYEFNTNAYCTMPGGELVFGGPKGLSVFKPEAIAVSAPVPNVLLSSFKVLGEETSLDSDVTRLSYKQDNLTFQFATTSYFRSAENQFAYRLEGLDHDWVYCGNRAYVTYSHVPPGDYTFRVKAANSSGIWNEKGVAYKISVSPPWWATWWFRIAAVLIIAAAIYLLYRYQLGQALKLQTIRNRIAGDLHDEIGSTLSSISIYSQVAKKEVTQKAPEAAAMLENITDSTTGMMDAMNDIVWMINTKNDRFDNIVDRMNAFANELLEAKNCNVHLRITPELQRLHLDMSQRKNLYLIFKEAINNAAKYADCRNVWIDISMNGSHKIMMSIKDDGKGFNINGESKGNGLLSMRKRAAELNGQFHFNSKIGEGTEMKLEFAL